MNKIDLTEERARLKEELKLLDRKLKPFKNPSKVRRKKNLLQFFRWKSKKGS